MSIKFSYFFLFHLIASFFQVDGWFSVIPDTLTNACPGFEWLRLLLHPHVKWDGKIKSLPNKRGRRDWRQDADFSYWFSIYIANNFRRPHTETQRSQWIMSRDLSFRKFLSNRRDSAACIRLTFLTRRPRVGVQIAQILRKPKPSRCLSGCPGETRRGVVWIKRYWLIPRVWGQQLCLATIWGQTFPERNGIFETSPTNEAIQNSLEAVSAGGSPEATPQTSSLWAGMF